MFKNKLNPLVLAGLLATPLAAATPELDTALGKITAQNLAAHVDQLASDRFEGRAPGTAGEALTVQYLAAQFAAAGAAPGNPDGTYFQQVPLVGYRSVPQLEVEAGDRKLALAFPADFI